MLQATLKRSGAVSGRRRPRATTASRRPQECSVVLVGCGSQAVRHLSCLSKLRDSLGIRALALVDPSRSNLEKCRQHAVRLRLGTGRVFSAESLREAAGRLDLADAIVDIVTPNKLHFKAAQEAVALGARRIVVEKPLAHTFAEAKRFLRLKAQVCVLENYLFSEVTRAVRRLLDARGWKPLFVKTEFSKDRRVDSANGRGTSGRYVPHVFTVEIPHQVAIVAHLLGSVGRVADAWDHDMILPDGRIAGHGEGAITLVHDNGVPSYNFSCLQGFRHLATSYRCAKVYCEDDIKVCGFYSTTVDLEGTVMVYRGTRLVHSESVADDSLKNGLREAVECLREERESLSNVQFGIDVLRVIEQGRRVAAGTP